MVFRTRRVRAYVCGGMGNYVTVFSRQINGRSRSSRSSSSSSIFAFFFLPRDHTVFPTALAAASLWRLILARRCCCCCCWDAASVCVSVRASVQPCCTVVVAVTVLIGWYWWPWERDACRSGCCCAGGVCDFETFEWCHSWKDIPRITYPPGESAYPTGIWHLVRLQFEFCNLQKPRVLVRQAVSRRVFITGEAAKSNHSYWSIVIASVCCVANGSTD